MGRDSRVIPISGRAAERGTISTRLIPYLREVGTKMPFETIQIISGLRTAEKFQQIPPFK